MAVKKRVVRKLSKAADKQKQAKQASAKGNVRKAARKQRSADRKTKKGNAPTRKKSEKNYSESGGMTAKGVRAYRKANPGSKLKTAVTGKVKKGSKDAKRRKSFCARMSGVKGPMKKPNGKPTRKALALRKWKC